MKGLKINLKLASQIPCDQFSKNIEDDKKAKFECTHIIDNIYVSGYSISQDYEYLTKNSFTNILNCASGSKNFKSELHSGIEYLLLDLKDDPEFDIIYAIYLTIDFIENNVKKNGGNILIHCYEVIMIIKLGNFSWSCIGC
jgi:hypothetical protein